MSAESLNADELIVKAELVTEFEEGEFAIDRTHEHLRTAMDLEGYQPIDPRKQILNSRTIKYTLKRREKSKSTVQRVKETLSFEKSEPEPMDYHRQLEETRDDLPYQIECRFFPFEQGERIELRTSLTIIPAIVLKHQQVSRQEDYNVQNAVRSCKEFARTISAELAWGFVTEPHTPAGNLRSTADDEIRPLIASLEYGTKALKFSDEGDEALKYGLDHSALASYIHAIEWTIITHLKAIADIDIPKSEGNGPGFYYGQLVDKLQNNGQVSQTTIENLRKHKTDRRIMAHHKSGKLESSHVYSVKKTLRNLLEESFREHQSD